MAHMEQFLISHPVSMLAAIVALEQTGVPIASAPMLVLIGALAGTGRVNTPLAFLVAVVAGVFVDCQWFELGRIRKRNPFRFSKMLHSADSGSVRIPPLFVRHRALALFVTRLIPGPNLAASIAGFAGVSRARFVLLDTAVTALWTLIYLAAGYFLPRKLLTRLGSVISALPPWGIILILGFAAVVLAALRFRRRLSRRNTPWHGNLVANAAEPIARRAENVDPFQAAASRALDSETSAIAVPRVGILVPREDE